jgi:clostripain
MGMAEIAYQYRPREGAFSADVMTFSPANEPADGYEYDIILSSIEDLSTLTAQQLAHHIVDSYQTRYQGRSGETQTAVDVTQMEEVANKLDALSSLIVDKKEDIEQTVRGEGPSPIALHYFDEQYSYEWNNYAIFDLYDVVNRIKENDYNDDINSACSDLLETIDGAVISSYYGTPPENFEEGKNGLGFFFPDGDGMYKDSTYWQHQYFYNSLAHEEFIVWAEGHLDSLDGYGALEMLEADEDGQVESWFELLQFWYNPAGSDQVHPGPMW